MENQYDMLMLYDEACYVYKSGSALIIWDLPIWDV